jgi:hypothetical protein
MMTAGIGRFRLTLPYYFCATSCAFRPNLAVTDLYWELESIECVPLHVTVSEHTELPQR